MAVFKCILAGLGMHGRWWARICRKHPEVEIVGYVARTRASRQRAVKEWEAPEDRLFGSLTDALASVKADFVLDVTPPAAHREIALTSFDAGLALLGEKPMSDSYRGAKDIAEAGVKAGCNHMIAQQRRFDSQPRATRGLLEKDTIGDPGQFDVSFFVPWADLPGSHYVSEPYMFLLDMGCHHFDMMRYVMNANPKSAQVISWNLPWGWHKGDASHVAIFDYPGGQKAIHRATGCSNGKPTPWSGNWRIEGPRGSITWEDDRIFVTQDYRTETNRRDEISIEETSAEKSTMAVLNEFLGSLKDGREPECSGRDNLKTMAMSFAALKSAVEGRRVDVSEIE